MAANEIAHPFDNADVDWGSDVDNFEVEGEDSFVFDQDHEERADEEDSVLDAQADGDRKRTSWSVPGTEACV
jgi:hypothetical protein